MKQRSGHLVDILFTLALFCVFAACALMVVIMGADVYSKSVDDMQHNFDARTSLSYISTKLRQGDVLEGDAPAVSIRQMDSTTQALVLGQTINGQQYRTWIYSYQGSLRELFTLAELQPSPGEGQAIMALPGLAMEADPSGLLRLTATDADGQQSELLYAPRSGTYTASNR